MSTMPKVDLECLYSKLNEKERKIVDELIKKDGRIKSTGQILKTGSAKYVWRNVAFYVSKNPANHSMPITADFYIKDEEFIDYIKEEKSKYDALRKYIKNELDPLVDKIVNCVPKEEWHGVKRWRGLI